ncbi:MAG: metallophosphoesterase [Clostridium sp.]|nr:metallophosphoesterase [Clostridium sp.]
MILLAVVGAFFLAVMAVDCNRFVIRTYHCKVNNLRKSSRAVLLSDLHNKSFGKGNEKLLAAIRNISPDLILIAGDMYTSEKDGDIDTAARLVCALAAEYPVYYGNGNHEQKTSLMPERFGEMYERFSERIKEAGARLLVNEKVYLPEFNLDIYGLQIGWGYYGKFKYARMEPSYLEGLIGRPNKERASVLIAHNPDYFDAYADWGAGLVVSGHVHGGLMRLPVLGGVISPAIRLFPKYDGGEFHRGGSTMILGRGLGTHTLPIRIFNPGEVAVVEMEP